MDRRNQWGQAIGRELSEVGVGDDKQIGWLHEAGRSAMQEIWERELGQERFAELQAELAERDVRQRQLDREYEQAELERRLTPDTASITQEVDMPTILPTFDEGLELGE
jgi:hypothetical protein